ncbi:hypothetical protein GON26_08040 [Flavobacterium sp. GA093]|uniref:CarboxypepD_reg-like domain-containing protein n=1 Tax=Flavobacterium hydrocarbonoxydans TaxID=2683249 RepID=A0A6I4NRI4_9FLAO|nr:hypothetical protein [Flavobacterium hydrocarbonoxydans]MWB94309.1 hypothetical protein [Flavobacterium hydrocarbonoxydans]
MKVKLLTTISFFSYQIGISQSEKLLHGKVVTGNTALKNVEVINKTALTSTRTNDSGEFAILVKPKDSLLFFSKEYFFKRLKITQENIEAKVLVVDMIIKPEELKEVVITKMPEIKLSSDKAYEQEKVDQYTIEKNASKPKTGVYDGTIENGMDLIRIGRMAIGLFVKEKEKVKEEAPKIEFKTLATTTCDQKFFIETLKLKPEEIALFLEFCDADPKSKTLLEHSNILTTMDFLYAKNEEFKKLKTEVQN